jgi:thiol-disulfide isomerase/thioredoxin
MPKITKAFIFILFIAGCSSKEKKENVSDINFYLKTKLEIDSILFANWTQDKEFQFLPYSDTIRINLNNKINDYYFINFFIGNKPIHHQFWLDGDKIIIKGSVSNNLNIDTIIGSELYYESIKFKRKLRSFKEQSEDNETVNNYLLSEFEKYKDDVFSIEIGNRFYQNNRRNVNELKKLYKLQLAQNKEIINRPDNCIKQIESILKINEIDFSEFQFCDSNGILSSISLMEGKKYLVDYWFVNCAPCLREHKLIKNKLEFLKSKGIEVIGISIDKNQKEWAEFLKKEKYEWLNYRENYDVNKRLRNHLQIAEFPTYIFLDDQGTIIQRFNAFSEFEEYLEKNNL